MVARTLVRIGLELLSLALLLVVLTALVSIPNKSAWQSTIVDGQVVDHLNFDKVAFWQNFKGYMTPLLHGHLGKSQSHRQEPVGKLVLQGAGYTFSLLAICMVIALVLGLTKGVFDHRRLSRPGFSVGPFLTAISQGLPDFWLVFLMQWFVIYAVKSWHWKAFPIVYDPHRIVASMVLPVVVMVIIPLGSIARVTAGALTEIEGADFIRTARAKGLHEWRVQLRHALRPVAGRILDAMPGVLTMMLSNLAIVEYLSGYPGLIRALLESILPPRAGTNALQNAFFSYPLDIPMVVASGVFLALVFVLIYEALRWSKGRFDPRLKGGRY